MTAGARARSSGVARVALVTCAAQPLLYGEEQDVLPALRALGVEAEALRWDDPAAPWGTFDAVVIRSPWDYFQRYAEFCAWLDRVELLAPVYNSPSLVRWNADKMYLRDLERRGVRIVPTVFCEAKKPVSLANVLRASGWEDAVMKPCVSGGAYRTHRVGLDDAASYEAEMEAVLAETGVLVQPFFPEIRSEGEWSFVFFDGTLSHVVLKVPVGDDYRVQTQFGGTFSPIEPEGWLLDQVGTVMSALPERPAYARIDGVCRGRDFYLMEAELIEPYLYMSAAPGSVEAYARVITKLARAGGP
jgi:hypothetical protein